MKLVEDLLKIRDLHFEARKQNNFKNEPELIRLANAFPEKAKKEIAQSDKISIKASLGSGTSSHTPFIGFYQSPQATSATNGVYIVIIFSADGERCYLGLSHSGIWGGYTKDRAKFSKAFVSALKKSDSWQTAPAGLTEQAEIAGGAPTGKDSQASFMMGFEISAGVSDENFLLKFEWLRSCLLAVPLESLSNTSNIVGLISAPGFQISGESNDIEFLATNNPDIDLQSAATAALFVLEDKNVTMLSGELHTGEVGGDKYRITKVVRTNLQGIQLEVAKEMLKKWSDSLCFHEIDVPTWGKLTGKIMADSGSEKSEITEAILTYRNLILEGVAGTGKTFALKEIESTGVFDATTLVVMHQNYGYEDFVEGLRPIGGHFEVADGVFTSACIEAAKNPEKKYLLVLDEINRSNTAKVLGELLYLIEPSKRLEPEDAATILVTQDSTVFGDAGVLLGLQRPKEDGSSFRLRLAMPSNLYLLGTMNTTDRSVGSLDLALRRRFVFRRIEPRSLAEMTSMLEDSDLVSCLPSWEKLNELLVEHIGRDAQIGHSYFFEAQQAKSRAAVGTVHLFRDLVLPQLCEILMTFGVVGLVEAAEFQEIDFKGWTVKLEGRGLDRLPYVANK